MSYDSYKIDIRLKPDYLECCYSPFKVGEIRCVFPKSWLLDWVNREDGGENSEDDVIDLRSLLKDDVPNYELNTDLLLSTDIFAMPIAYADCLFARYLHTPSAFKKASEPFHANAGMIYRIPQDNDPLSSFMDFNIFKAIVEIDGILSPILLVDELTIGDVVKLTLSNFQLDHQHGVYLQYDKLPVELPPYDQRPFKDLHSSRKGEAKLRVKKLLIGKKYQDGSKGSATPLVLENQRFDENVQEARHGSFRDSNEKTDERLNESFTNPHNDRNQRSDENLQGEHESFRGRDQRFDANWQEALLESLRGSSEEADKRLKEPFPNQFNDSFRNQKSDGNLQRTPHEIFISRLDIKSNNPEEPEKMAISPTPDHPSRTFPGSAYHSLQTEPLVEVLLEDNIQIYVHPMDSIASVCRQLVQLTTHQEGFYPVFCQRKTTADSQLIHAHLTKPISELPEAPKLRLFIRWEPITETETDLINYWKKSREDFINLLCFMKDPPIHQDLVYRVGLDNWNSACYLNSILQCLTHLKAIRNYFTNNDDLLNRLIATESLLGDFDNNLQLTNSYWKNKNLCGLMYWFIHILQFFHTGQSSTYDPKEMLNCFCNLFKDFEFGSSNDALMCLCGLLDSFHNFLSQSQESSSTSSKVSQSSSLITSTFTGKLMTFMRCKFCSHTTKIEGDARFLSLDIGHQSAAQTFVVYYIPDGEWFDMNRPTRVTLSLENLDITFEDLAVRLIPNFSRYQWHPFVVNQQFRNTTYVSWQDLVSRIPPGNHLFFYEHVHPDECFAEFLSNTHSHVILPPLPLKHVSQWTSKRDVHEVAFKLSPAMQYLLRFLKEREIWIEFRPAYWDGKRAEYFFDVKSGSPDSIWNFKDLSQPKQDGVSLNDLLEKHSSPTVLCKGSDFFCYSCDSLDPRNALTWSMFSAPPQVLVFHLPRFGSTGSSHQKKNSIHVFCPNRLDMSKNVMEENCFIQYQLVAAVSHSGNDINTGHYRAFCKPRMHTTKEWNICGDNWISFDDAVVTDVDSLPTNEIVLVFYEAITFD